MSAISDSTTAYADVGRRASLAVERGDRPAVLPDPDDVEPERGWYTSLAFEGRLDPAGTLFAFGLSVAATVGLVVLVAAVVRIVTGS